MKQAFVCFALVVALQCLEFARAQKEPAIGFDPRVSKSEDVDVQVMMTATRLSTGSYVPADPKSREDHNLILGICGFDNYNAFAGEGMFNPANPENHTTSMGVTVKFRQDAIIVCIQMINMRDDVDGEDVGGYPSVSGGGIGYNFVDMWFTSPDGQEMVFQYEVFAWDPEVTTTTEAPGGAQAIGKPRELWLLLCYLVLFFKCIV